MSKPEPEERADGPPPVETLGEDKPFVASLRIGTVHDMRLVRLAIESRVDDLKALAKKNRDEGYQKQSHAVEMDADRLKEEFLSVLEPQETLKLGYSSPHDAAQAIVGTALHKIVKDRELADKILVNCAAPIAKVVRHALILGYETGLAEASASVDALVLRAFERALGDPAL